MKFHGWLRLWVLLSAVWCLLTASAVGVLFATVLSSEVEGPWLTYRLSAIARPYFENRPNGNQAPFFVEAVRFQGGKVIEIEFDGAGAMDAEPATEMARKLRALDESEADQLSDAEIQRFSELVTRRKSEAASAHREYQSVVAAAHEARSREKRQALQIALIVALTPTVLALARGYGVAWVRRGFR